MVAAFTTAFCYPLLAQISILVPQYYTQAWKPEPTNSFFRVTSIFNTNQ